MQCATQARVFTTCAVTTVPGFGWVGPAGPPGPAGPAGPAGPPGAGAQTPWASNINGANYNLTNVGSLTNIASLGIGTASPAATLQVVGPYVPGTSTAGPARITGNAATCYLTLDTQQSPGYSAVMFLVGGAYGAEIGYASNQLQFWDQQGHAEPSMVIDTSSATPMVGIGTASPAYKLDVNGDINLSGQIRRNGVVIL